MSHMITRGRGDRRRTPPQQLLRAAFAPGELKRPPVSVLCGRTIYGGEPLNDDTTLDGDGYTREWNANTSGLEPSEWSLVVNADEVAAGYHYTTGSGGSLKYWLSWKLKPYRIRLGMDTTQTTDAFYRPYGTYHLDQYDASSWGLTPVNLRATGPPAAGHAGNIVSTNPEWFSLLVLNRSLFEPSAPNDANVLSHSMYARYVRYVINGVDVTGPLAIDDPISTTIDHGGFSVIGKLLAGTVSYPNGIDITDATIDIDLWHEVAVGGSSIGNLSGTGTSPWNGGGSAEGWHVVSMMARTYYAWTGEVYPRIGRVMFTGGNGHNRMSKNKTIVMEFDRQAPGSTSILRLQPQTGWTPSTVDYDGQVTMTHTASGDIVEFYYAQESPCIVLYRATANNVPTGYLGFARYYPVDDSTYDKFPLITNPIPYVEPIRGTWNPKTPTVFRLAGRRAGGSLTATMEPIGQNGSSRDENSNRYDRFPFEITVYLE